MSIEMEAQSKIEQRDAALQRANDIRLGRAQIKREIYDGTVTICDVLETQLDIMDSMTIFQLLTAQKGWSTVRYYKFMQPFAISPERKLRELTRRERMKLCQHWYERTKK